MATARNVYNCKFINNALQHLAIDGVEVTEVKPGEWSLHPNDWETCGDLLSGSHVKVGVATNRFSPICCSSVRHTDGFIEMPMYISTTKADMEAAVCADWC